MSKSSKGKRMKNIFNKRFGDRISVVYVNEADARSQHIQNTAISRAMIDVMTGILGREPTQNEILGIEDISKKAIFK